MEMILKISPSKEETALQSVNFGDVKTPWSNFINSEEKQPYNKQELTRVNQNYFDLRAFLETKKSYFQQLHKGYPEKVFNTIWEEILNIVVDQRLERIDTITKIGEIFCENSFPSSKKLSFSFAKEVEVNVGRQRGLVANIMNLMRNSRISPKIKYNLLIKIFDKNTPRSDLINGLLYSKKPTEEFFQKLGLYLDRIYGDPYNPSYYANKNNDYGNGGVEADRLSSVNRSTGTVMKTIGSIFNKLNRSLTMSDVERMNDLSLENLTTEVQVKLGNTYDLTRITVYVDDLLTNPWMAKLLKVNLSLDVKISNFLKKENQIKFVKHLVDSLIKLKKQADKNGQLFKILSINPKLVLSGYSDWNLKVKIDGKIYEIQMNLDKNSTLKKLETPEYEIRKNIQTDLNSNPHFGELLNDFIRINGLVEMQETLKKKNFIQRALSFPNDPLVLKFKEFFRNRLTFLEKSAKLNPELNSKVNDLLNLKNIIDSSRGQTLKSLARSRAIFSQEEGILSSPEDAKDLKFKLGKYLQIIEQQNPELASFVEQIKEVYREIIF